MPKKAQPVKMCLKCHNVYPLTDFFSNKAWGDQSYVDIYCKECARKLCYNKETMRKYLWENGRAYSEEMWAAAEKRAMRYLANNEEYLSRRTPKNKKEEIKEKSICNQMFTVMNLTNYYVFNDPVDHDGNIKEFDPNSLNGTVVMTEDGESTFDEGAKMYSAVWNGLYTKRELEYLDAYYDKLSEDFVLDNASIQDYARKIVKNSWIADQKCNDYQQGKCTLKEWQDAQAAFDMMSKSAAFAACQRKDKANSSDMILCKIIEDIEVNHHAAITPVEFEKDDIDRILEDFAHTDVAIK